MKPLLRVLLPLLAVTSVVAADVQFEAIRPQSPRAKSQAGRAGDLPRKKRFDEIVTYSGFLTEVARTNKPAKLLSIRKRADPIRDVQNIHLDDRSGKPNGFRLFSVDF